ncbi:uncharacterized protein LOC110228428 [Arabidopsis lyrata subsp. lyrata]|nr:uncharacterized protein LOC110228428 [Arabidopsis lyrata subsp. lyrata]|eukprot:XP_020881613.1 uncharacterized protein LOC110228428 [Arabidopsis lyrata subsp. lyrata]
MISLDFLLHHCYYQEKKKAF